MVKVTNEQNVKKKKGLGCLIPVLLFMMFCFILSTVIRDKAKEAKNNTDTIASKYIDLSSEEGKLIDTILNNCGITEIKTFEYDTLLDNAHSDGETGYRLSINDSVDNIILYLNADKTVYSLSYNTYTLYSDNTVLATLQDYTVSMDELNNYQYLCQEKVKEILKSPNTANFPNYTQWGFKQEKNIFTIQGYVDAQNGFGAEVRSTFQFIIDADTNTILSFIFDGEELISK